MSQAPALISPFVESAKGYKRAKKTTMMELLVTAAAAVEAEDAQRDHEQRLLKLTTDMCQRPWAHIRWLESHHRSGTVLVNVLDGDLRYAAECVVKSLMINKVIKSLAAIQDIFWIETPNKERKDVIFVWNDLDHFSYPRFIRWKWGFHKLIVMENLHDYIITMACLFE